MIVVEIEEESMMMSSTSLPLLSLNHVSLVVRSVWTSVRFYQDVLGFFLIKRPSSFNFHGAWLFNYGIGIHLLQNESMDDDSETANNVSRPINPKDNHISFQCSDVELVKRRLEEMEMKYVTAVVKEERVEVNQVFFHDPDGYMIEICNCDVLPVLPLSSSCPSFKPRNFNEKFKKINAVPDDHNCWMIETAMMESLSMDMMNFSF